MWNIHMSQFVRDALITVTVCGATVLSVSPFHILLFTVVSLHIFRQIFLTGATAVAITSIGKDLHFQQDELEWPTNVYTWVFA